MKDVISQKRQIAVTEKSPELEVSLQLGLIFILIQILNSFLF